MCEIMELPLKSVSGDCEIRSFIRFFAAKNFSGVQIHKELVSVYGPKCMSEQMVRCWKEDFIKGRENVHAMNNARDGQCMPLGIKRQFS